jgi:threonine dehydratase
MMSSTQLPDFDDCTAAARTLAGRIHRTPMFSSRSLGERIGREAHIKAELFQRTGSFKLRGLMNRVAALSPAERAAGAVTVSAGNAAQAAALACAEAGVDLVVHALAERSGRVVLHPYDDPLVIAGQGTVGLEVCAEIAAPAAVLVPASGGGLVSGVALAVKALAPQARVIAVQPLATATLRATRSPAVLERASRPEQPGTTIADALTAPVFGEACMGVCTGLLDEVVHLDEDEIREGMRFIYARAKLACEPGAAVAVAALLAGRVADLGDGPVVAIVSGGNVTPAVAAAIIAPA